MIKEYLFKKIDINKYKSDENRFFKHSTLNFNVLLILNDFIKSKTTIFVCLPNLYEAQKYYDAFMQLTDEDDVLFYPGDQTLTAMMALGSPEFKSERLFTLRKLLTNKPFIVVTTKDGLSSRQLNPDDYINSVLELKKDQEYNQQKLIRLLINNGYERVFTVEKPGEFSVRGSIVDFFTLNYPYPYRLDFFGDLIDEIKVFDVESQRSLEKKNDCLLVPMNELFYTDKMLEEAIESINSHFLKFELSEREVEKLDKDINLLKDRKKLESLNLYIPFFNQNNTTVLDFSINRKLYLIDTPKMEINEEQIKDDLKTFSHTLNGEVFTKLKFRLGLDYCQKQANYDISNQGIDLMSIEVAEYKGGLDLFLLDINSYKEYTIIISLSDENRLKDLTKHFNNNKIEYNLEKIIDGKINIVKESINLSFVLPREKVILINEEKLFSVKIRGRIQYRSVINQSVKIRHVDDLRIGDFVVHYDYGIGEYLGLKTMELGSGKRDYLQIIYQDNEMLYVPVDQIELVLKYSNYEGTRPKLSKMSGKSWGRTKLSAKLKIKELSDRLISLYARRNEAVGFAFDSEHQEEKELELDFIYEETKDQKRAIMEVKNDMELTKPMDRLICGDVGFGKTEVAIRAAFKAILSAKQVIYLVPTTVLARQHYYTFKERLEKYGCNIALLSRFTTNKKQQEIIGKLKSGFIDIVIGTHRLLSDDVKLKDLGLFIIDEEQRFGVLHKEKIKEMKVNVDTLTLSATPIPRTMQMSMMGLKDLSMIETPPLNRYPVQTYVVEREDALTKEAIEREIARGGQVFYLFNNTQKIQFMVERIKELVPSARVTFAHGQMPKEKLEDVLSDFIDHYYDVLVATTIIETGIDIPNTNTLIIHEADKLGLSQLYQIRGRVGRSDRIAYAYLMYEKNKVINDEALKRLSAIEDFTALGSGYKIAMRDLSIRGAGDILGSEQSGFIDTVGLELYMKLLDEAIHDNDYFEQIKLKSNDEVYANRHIDEVYINDDAVRIEIHKRISNLSSMKDCEDLKEELIDRFGDINSDLILYIYEKLFKKLSYKLGVEKTQKLRNTITLIISKEASNKIDGTKLFAYATSNKLPVRLGYIKERVQITIDLAKTKDDWLFAMAEFLDGYIN